MDRDASGPGMSVESAAASCLLALALLLGSATTVIAGQCDPDFSGTDRITKERVEQWQQVLTSTGLLSAALMDNDVTFSILLTRAGSKNLVSVAIQKVEENLARASFETQFRAARGDEVLFGFKNGSPVNLTITKGSNSAKAGSFSGKLNMSAVWEAEVSDTELANIRDALTTRLIDAIRITAASGQIDRAIPEKNAQRLMQKFGCFCRAVDSGGGGMASANNALGPGAAPSPMRGGGGSQSPLEAAVRSTANCRVNFAVHGSMARGTSYETFDEIGGISYASALGVLEAVLTRASLTIDKAEKTAGTLTATGPNDKAKTVTYDFTIVPTSNGVRVSMSQALRVGRHGSDDAVRDSMCKILSSMAEVAAKAQEAGAADVQVPKVAIPQPSRAPTQQMIKPETTNTAAPSTVEERLRQLDELRKKGLVSEEEYKKKRAQILSAL
jgi:hypothetical protein